MITESKILIVDDEKTQRDALAQLLEMDGYAVKTASNGAAALNIIDRFMPSVVITDFKMPNMSGSQLISAIKKKNPLIEAIVVTAYGNIDIAVDAMKKGAYDFITKPIDFEHLSILIKKASEKRMITIENIQLKQQLSSVSHKIIGESDSIKKVLSVVKRVAGTDVPVMITGESGTGKELVVDALHKSSGRKGNLIKINAAAIPIDLLESELFGYEKGAFTGAESSKVGKFDLASKGTLFLDEIGDMPYNLQSKLLRVLQEKMIMPIGASSEHPIDVRIIAATNQNLDKRISTGAFRNDLYYRLSVIKIDVPPLRERKEDIPILAEEFCREFASRYNKNIKGFTQEALQALTNYDYPGNIRELRNYVERAVILSHSSLIDVSLMPSELKNIQPDTSISIDNGLEAAVEALERDLIKDALETTGMVQTRAAQKLKISERVLRYKLAKYGFK